MSGYKFGSGVVWIGVPSQRGGHGNGLGRGVGVGLIWAGTTAAMLTAAMNNSKQRISRNRECLHFMRRRIHTTRKYKATAGVFPNQGTTAVPQVLTRTPESSQDRRPKGPPYEFDPCVSQYFPLCCRDLHRQLRHRDVHEKRKRRHHRKPSQ